MKLKRVDKNNPIPLYYQLKTIIREMIETKEWKPSDKIPSEAYLSDHNKISPMTARQAINELCDERLLYKVRGNGTFVSKPKLERDLSELTSLTEKLKDSGYTINRKVLGLRTVPATKNVAEKLETNKGEEVIRLERLMTFEDEPFYHEISFLPYELCPPLLREDFSQNSIYHILESRCRMNLDYANLTIEAILCKPYHRTLLRIKKGVPVLHLNQVTYLINGRPVQFVDAVARNDIYKYSLVRKKRR